MDESVREPPLIFYHKCLSQSKPFIRGFGRLRLESEDEET